MWIDVQPQFLEHSRSAPDNRHVFFDSGRSRSRKSTCSSVVVVLLVEIVVVCCISGCTHGSRS